jgi:hypothetical protein
MWQSSDLGLSYFFVLLIRVAPLERTVEAHMALSISELVKEY